MAALDEGLGVRDEGRGDTVIYAHVDGYNYVGCFDGQWLRWPAVSGGWARRVACPEATADDCWELEPRLGALALLLSGVADTRGSVLEDAWP